MMRGHDLFESLAGAIALGEATDAESAKFATHAAGCDRCRPDLDLVPARVTTALRELSDAETWRPSIRDGLGNAIAARRQGRARIMGSALATAAAFSVALNVGFSNGSLARFAAHFTQPATSEAAPIAFMPRIPPAHSSVDIAPPALAAVPVHHHHAATHPHVTVKPATLPPQVDAEPPLPTLDVFGGLAIDPEAEKTAPHVAKAEPETSDASDTGSADTHAPAPSATQ